MTTQREILEARIEEARWWHPGHFHPAPANKPPDPPNFHYIGCKCMGCGRIEELENELAALPQQVSEGELEALRELSEKATPGPWEASIDTECIATLAKDIGDEDIICIADCVDGKRENWADDFRFTAASVNYVRKLLAAKEQSR